MKTQLIQDFNESGSAPAGSAPAAPAPATPAPAAAAPAAPAVVSPPPVPASPAVESTEPATQPRPAVWHRPQQAQVRDPRVPLQTHGFAPQPPGFSSTDAQETTVPDTAASMNASRQMRPRDTTDVNSDADWLTELLARDAAEQSESQRSGRWTRRLATWGTASVLLALLAAGGLWLYQESQVEGALVVVANTSPAPAATTARPSLTGAAAASPRSPGLAAAVAAPPPAPQPAAAQNRADAGAGAEAGAEAGAAAVGGMAGGSTASAAGDAPSPAASAAEPAVPAPKPKRTHVRKHPKAESTAEIPADSEPSARQRHEETLLQCRAHGYDEQQCVERGCEMTRYGFACKG